MGLRFRKSIKIGKDLRINFSTKGIGYSVGGKGIRYTRSANGKHYNTYSLPGTGLSYRQSLDGKSKTPNKNKMHPSVNSSQPVKSKNTPLATIIVIIVMVLIVGFLIKMFAKPSNNQSTVLSDTTISTKYSEIELLTLKNHPRIYDDYRTAQEFYNTIGDDRVKVIEISEYARIRQNLPSYSSDKNILYIVKQAEEKYFGNVHFNIICPSAANLSVENVTSIILDYLPENFFEYYDEDLSYIYEDDHTTAYTYSARLNEKGVEYHNNQAPQYSYYFYFRIFNFDGGKYWRAETGFAAYGDKDKGWVEKNAEKWDIDLQALSNKLVEQ